MKTGTITFHAPNNNGSFLQAYALQTVLKNQLGGGWKMKLLISTRKNKCGNIVCSEIQKREGISGEI